MDKNNRVNQIDKKEKILCRSNEPGRVDSFLLKMFPDYSRSYFQKLIKADLVLVNGKKINKSFLIKEGDSADISFPKPPSIKGTPQDVPFGIVDIQKDFLIINKPCNLMVHKIIEQQAGNSEPTLVDGLLYRFNEFGEFGDSERPGIVHRLDKDTSGLMIVARNIKAQIALSEMLKERQVEKRYLALVKGHPDQSGKIEFSIGRHPSMRTRMSHASYNGRPALTYYRVEQYYKDYSVVSIRIVTGRTHQIRVHFAAIGHNVVGDKKYGKRSLLIGRQALHSWKLSFRFNGKAFSYYVPVPEDFRMALKGLKGSILDLC